MRRRKVLRVELVPATRYEMIRGIPTSASVSEWGPKAVDIRTPAPIGGDQEPRLLRLLGLSLLAPYRLLHRAIDPGSHAVMRG
jgi:hypothetical protein